MRRRTWIVLAVVLAAAAGIAIWQINGQQAATPEVELVTVTRGALSEVVNAAGSVDPSKSTTLSFEISGRVNSVLVKTGQTVREGDVLARLDASDLELALKSAQASLDSARARYDQVKAGPSAEEIAAAEASLESATAGYDKLKAGPSADEVATAKANLERTEAVLKQAQAAYDRIAWMPGAGATPQALQLQQATIDHDAALANYRLATQGASESALKSALAQIAQARANLARLKNSPTPEDLAIAEAQVKSAEVAVEQAQARLDSAVLRAMHDGIVERVYVKEGQLVSPGSPAIAIGDHSSFHIMLSVDELDISKVQLGQKAQVVLDALPDRSLSGHVEEIGIVANQATGVASYDVEVAIDPSNAPLRVGMSATVEIVTAEKQSVLLLPNRAIQYDAQTGAKFVIVLRNGNQERVEIETGVRDERNTEILKGLSEGEQVLPDATTSQQSLRDLFQPGGN